MKKMSLLLIVLILSACANHEHTLKTEHSDTFIRGQLVHDRGSENLLILETREHRYEARGFEVKKNTHIAELSRQYSNDSKHWGRISSGLDTDHITYETKVQVQSTSGQSPLSCHLKWGRPKNITGTCTDHAGNRFLVAFQ